MLKLFMILFNHNTILMKGDQWIKEKVHPPPVGKTYHKTRVIGTVGTMERERLGQEAQKPQSPFQNFLPHKGAFQTHGPQMDNAKRQRHLALCLGKAETDPSHVDGSPR